MTPKLLQLYSLRAQVEALIATEEAEQMAAVQVAGCPHPEDKRVNTSTMGGGPTRFYCTECRESVTSGA